MFRKLWVSAAVVIVMLSPPVSAACLSAANESLDMARKDPGMVTAEWSAEVTNRCEVPQDATIRIRFMSVSGESLHETMNFVILAARESKQARQTVTLPIPDLSVIDRTEVDITERERPRL